MFASSSGFGIDFDILGSNLINIVLIVVLLVYLGRNVISGILGSRKAEILAAIEEAERRQKEASEQLAEQQGKLAQAQKEAVSIKQRAEESAKALREQIAAEAVEDVAKVKAIAQKEIESERERIMAQLRRQTVQQALEQVERDLAARMDDGVQARLIDKSIQLLGGR